MVAKRRKQNEPGSTEAADSPTVRKRIRRLKRQAWFSSPEWQSKEREADEDIAAGRDRLFMSDDEFLA